MIDPIYKIAGIVHIGHIGLGTTSEGSTFRGGVLLTFTPAKSQTIIVWVCPRPNPKPKPKSIFQNLYSNKWYIFL